MMRINENGKFTRAEYTIVYMISRLTGTLEDTFSI